MAHQWRGVIAEYRDYLPFADSDTLLTLGEGGTPLVHAPALDERTGAEVHIKVEGMNPTGSFKDRGMVSAMSRAVSDGAQSVVCASTGNTSASAAAYATRARTMMNTYRREGTGRVYWLTLPLPRDGARQRIARTVNAAVRAAAGAYRAQGRILDMTSLFTPGGRFRDSMPVDGKQTLVREPDGIHLNEAGSELAASVVQRALAQDFEDVPQTP